MRQVPPAPSSSTLHHPWRQGGVPVQDLMAPSCRCPAPSAHICLAGTPSRYLGGDQASREEKLVVALQFPPPHREDVRSQGATSPLRTKGGARCHCRCASIVPTILSLSPAKGAPTHIHTYPLSTPSCTPQFGVLIPNSQTQTRTSIKTQKCTNTLVL